MVDEAVTTSRIEGEILDRDSVRSSVAHRLSLPTAGLPAPTAHIDGLVAMLDDATSSDAPLTAERLMGWHAALFPTGYSGIRRIQAGTWRASAEPMQVVSGRIGRETVHFEAPPSADVSSLMTTFLAWLSHGPSPCDAVLRAGFAHLVFLTIHPFEDGNGRVARAVADMVLSHDGGLEGRVWSLSAQIETDKAQYYDELQRAQQGSPDITAWLTWFAGCVERAAGRAERRVDDVLAKARFWHRHVATPLNARQRKAVNRLLDAGRDGFPGGLNNRKYASLTRCSRATAQRDLADLVTKGLLERLPGGGRNASYGIAWPGRP